LQLPVTCTAVATVLFMSQLLPDELPAPGPSKVYVTVISIPGQIL
jgi:hypothetical protein